MAIILIELDRPWTDVPFVFQGFLLKKPQQVEVLRKYCAWVMVDPDRSELQDPSALGKAAYTERASVEHEFMK